MIYIGIGMVILLVYASALKNNKKLDAETDSYITATQVFLGLIGLVVVVYGIITLF